MPRRADSQESRDKKRKLGARIRAERDRAGLTQQQLADALSKKLGGTFSPKTIATWENQRREPPVAPSAAILEHIASALGCQLSALQVGAEDGAPAYEIDLQRLARKLARWRVNELSRMATQNLRQEVDAIISRHKDKREPSEG